MMRDTSWLYAAQETESEDDEDDSLLADYTS